MSRSETVPRYQFQRYKLGEGLEFAVNTANGNGLLKQTDFKLENTDLDFSLERYYNTLSDRDTATGQDGWSSNPGDVRLASPAGGSVVLEGPSGYTASFVRRSDGTYKTPPGLSEELVKTAEGGYTLSDPETLVAHEFDSSGRLTAKTEEADQRTEYRYDERGLLSSISDTEGRVTEYEYNDKGALTAMTDSAGRRHVYERDLLRGYLTAYVAPNDERTEFGYDLRSGKLDSIKAPNGKLTRIGYDAQYRVTSVTEDASPVPVGGLGNTTKYAYDTIGRTVATAADGRESLFRFDASGMGLSATVGSSPPTLTLSGDLSDTRSRSLTDGEGYELTVEAGDSSGIRSVTAALDGEAESLDELACEDCGVGSKRFVFNTDDANPGEYVVRLEAVDESGEARSESLRFTVPPKPPLEEGTPEPPADPEPPAQPVAAPAEPAGSQPAVYLPESGGLRFMSAQSSSSIVFGMADEAPEAYRHPLMFGDSEALNPTTVRRIVQWNLADLPETDTLRNEFQDFYNINKPEKDATGAIVNPGRQMMVAFKLPDPHPDGARGPNPYTDYKRATLKFKATWPEVKVYTPWNEPNLSDATLGQRVKRAAEYTHVAQRYLCNGDCAVMAGALAHTGVEGRKATFRSYLKQYGEELERLNRKNRVRMPVYWGFHPYRDVEKLRVGKNSALHFFIQGTPATNYSGSRQPSKIWLDEVGGFFRYRRLKPRRVDYINDAGEQAERVKHLVNVLAPMTRPGRVERVYYYYFCRVAPGFSIFDTALLGPPPDFSDPRRCGDIRPAFNKRNESVPPAFQLVRDAIRGGREAQAPIADPPRY